MNKRNILFPFLSILLLTSCGGGGKKVLIMASGKVTMQGNTVTLAPGTSHTEVTYEPSGDNISIVSPSGNKEVAVKEPGLYILNLKTDTIVGSYQETGTDNSQKVITQDDVWNRVDSLTKLMTGANVSAASRNYNIPPMEISRITANTDAEIIGPYRKIPGSFDPSRKHEVYKFSTNPEIKETIDNVKKKLSN
jgi:hypothetical protein